MPRLIRDKEMEKEYRKRYYDRHREQERAQQAEYRRGEGREKYNSYMRMYHSIGSYKEQRENIQSILGID